MMAFGRARRVKHTEYYQCHGGKDKILDLGRFSISRPRSEQRANVDLSVQVFIVTMIFLGTINSSVTVTVCQFNSAGVVLNATQGCFYLTLVFNWHCILGVLFVSMNVFSLSSECESMITRRQYPLLMFRPTILSSFPIPRLFILADLHLRTSVFPSKRAKSYPFACLWPAISYPWLRLTEQSPPRNHGLTAWPWGRIFQHVWQC